MGVNLSILIISSPLLSILIFKTSKQGEGLITPFSLTNFKNIQTRWRETIPLYSPPHYSPLLYSPLPSSLSKLPNRPLILNFQQMNFSPTNEFLAYITMNENLYGKIDIIKISSNTLLFVNLY